MNLKNKTYIVKKENLLLSGFHNKEDFIEVIKIEDVDLAVAKLKKDIKNESFYIKNNGPEYLTVRQVNKLIEKRLEK